MQATNPQSFQPFNPMQQGVQSGGMQQGGLFNPLQQNQFGSVQQQGQLQQQQGQLQQQQPLQQNQFGSVQQNQLQQQPLQQQQFSPLQQQGQLQPQGQLQQQPLQQQPLQQNGLFNPLQQNQLQQQPLQNQFSPLQQQGQLQPQGQLQQQPLQNQFNQLQQPLQNQFSPLQQQQNGMFNPNQFNPLQPPVPQAAPIPSLVIDKTPRYVSLISSLSKKALEDVIMQTCDVNQEQLRDAGINHTIDVGKTMASVGLVLQVNNPITASQNPGIGCIRVPNSGKKKGQRCNNPVDMHSGQGKICLACYRTAQGKALLAGGIPPQQQLGYGYQPNQSMMTGYVQPSDSLFKPVNYNNAMGNQPRDQDVIKQGDALPLIPEYSIFVLARTPGVITSQSNSVHQLVGKLSEDRRSVIGLTPDDEAKLYRLNVMGENCRRNITERIQEVYANPQRLAAFNDALSKTWSNEINIRGDAQPLQQLGQPLSQPLQQFGQPLGQLGQPMGQPLQQFGQPMGQPLPQSLQQFGQPLGQPMGQFGQPLQQFGQPLGQPLGSLVIPAGTGLAIGEQSSTDDSLNAGIGSININADDVDSIDEGEIEFATPAVENNSLTSLPSTLPVSLDADGPPFIENIVGVEM